jgi:hypothetical protein
MDRWPYTFTLRISARTEKGSIVAFQIDELKDFQSLGPPVE